MKKLVIIGILSLLAVLTIGCLEEKTSEIESQTFPILEGPYLGQKPPGLKAELFAPGIVSTSSGSESNCSFSPDGKTFMFGYGGSSWGIVTMEEVNGRWTEPQIAPFSGKYADYDFNFAPVGEQFLFSSAGTPIEGKKPTIWVVNKTAEGWSQVNHIGFPFGTDSDEDNHYPSVTKKGVLYFYSDREGGIGSGDIYRSRFENGKYQEPENLGPTINDVAWDGDPCVSPDEDYLIFTKQGSGNVESGMYISFRAIDDTWSKAIRLDSEFNSSTDDTCPNISADGKYIFFASKRENPNEYPSIELRYKKKQNLEPVKPEEDWDIYWIDASVVEQYRPR